MKRSTKLILITLILTPLIGISSLVLYFRWYFREELAQMKAGRAYMNSLSDQTIQPWIDRTAKYLADYDPKAYSVNATIVPPELQKLKILRIDVFKDGVWY